MAQQPPFAQALSVSSSAANPLSIENGFLLASNQTLTSTYAIDPNYRIGYAQTWTISVQHDLPFSMFGTIGYLGTKGTRLDQQFIPNSVPPGATESALPHSFIYQTSNGNSIYHAAQFQLNRRFHSGIMAHAVLPVFEIHRQRRHRRARPGRHAGGAELARSLRRAWAFQFRCATQPVRALSVQHRHGNGRRHAGAGLEGRPLEGLDARWERQPSLRESFHRDHRREPLAGRRNGSQ